MNNKNELQKELKYVIDEYKDTIHVECIALIQRVKS